MSTPPPSTEKSAKSKTINFNNALTSFLVLSLVIFSGWSFFGYQQSKKEIVKLSSLEGQQELAEQKLKTLLEQVKKHMLLPEEEPVVATISDVDALIADNQFFEGASNGDKVIVYTEAKQAIVYSPEMLKSARSLLNQAVLPEKQTLTKLP